MSNLRPKGYDVSVSLRYVISDTGEWSVYRNWELIVVSLYGSA